MAIDFSKLGNKISSVIQGATPSASSAESDLLSLIPDSGQVPLWSIKGDDWYKLYGHQFEVVIKSQQQGIGPLTQAGVGPNDDTKYFTLPIPPQSIVISPVFPNQTTPTAGGVVEEVSSVVFWRINMSGTMGIAVGRSDDDINKKQRMAEVFRTRVSTTGLLSGISAELNQTINKASNIIGSLSDIANNPLAAVVGAVNNTLLPPNPYTASAVPQNSNGFTEIHELQKFFYHYHTLKSADPDKYELYFTQLKTNQRWRVVVKNYTIKQSAPNSHLYRYDMALVGWDCKDSGSVNRTAVNRFGPDGDLAEVNTLGVNALPMAKSIGSNISSLWKKI